jgi:hypothetical protein
LPCLCASSGRLLRPHRACRTLANISNDGPPADNGDNEVDIAVNPTNPSNMIAGSKDYGVGGSCGVGWTNDGGKTWSTDWLHGLTPEGGNPTYDYGAGDPSVGFLNDGTAIFTCNAWSNTKPTAIFVTTSADGGQTWASPRQVASANTKAGNLPSPDGGTLLYPVARKMSAWSHSWSSASAAVVTERPALHRCGRQPRSVRVAGTSAGRGSTT